MTTSLAPRSCSLCSRLHFGFLFFVGSDAPSELHVAGMPIDHKRSASFSPSTQAISEPAAIAFTTSGRRYKILVSTSLLPFLSLVPLIHALPSHRCIQKNFLPFLSKPRILRNEGVPSAAR